MKQKKDLQNVVNGTMPVGKTIQVDNIVNFPSNEQSIDWETQSIEHTVKEAVLELIKRSQESYPFSLKAKNIMELMNCSQTQAYTALEKGNIPGAKKIPGLG
ncbi:MAG: hypothetical protein ACOCRK_09190, partial [bacterium]